MNNEILYKVSSICKTLRNDGEQFGEYLNNIFKVFPPRIELGYKV